MLIDCDHLGYEPIVPNKQVLANVLAIPNRLQRLNLEHKNLVPSKYELKNVTIND